MSTDVLADYKITEFPTEYVKKKRLYIVRNFEEISQSDYENEMDRMLDQQQK